MGDVTSRSSARTQPASGRVFWCLLLALAAGGCTVLRPGAGSAGDTPFDPVLSDERPSRAGEAAAAELFERARVAQGAGDLVGARSAATEVVERYPGAPVSGRALRLLADVAFAQESWREADLLAQRWIRLVPDADPRVPPLRLVQGEARIRDGDPGGALDRLSALPVPMAPDLAATALDLVRRAGTTLDVAAFAARLGALPAGHPFAAPLYAARARALYNTGDEDDARRSADAALAAGAQGVDAEVSRAVLDRRIDESLGLIGPLTVLGVLLPKTGPPALARFAAEVEEGIRAAAAATQWPGRLQVVVQDDRGTAEGAAAGMRALEEQGAVAVVGPLDGPELGAAAMARTRPIPILSPTAPGGGGEPNVYTLGGIDLEGARALGRWAAEAGIRRVVILNPRGEDPEQEAAAFAEAFRAAGGNVLRSETYARGTTYFEEQMRMVESLRPDALVLPIPAEDVQTVAPQVTFFGLDTLGIGVLGTAGWTREDVLAAVNPRHTDGVVAVTPDPLGDADAEGMRTLVSAYEGLYRRTLRSAVPSVGYDAAALLLEALRAGARTPAAVASALADIDAFPGATGRLAVEADRITRRHQVVCIQGRRLRTVRMGEGPALVNGRRSCPGLATPAGDQAAVR